MSVLGRFLDEQAAEIKILSEEIVRLRKEVSEAIIKV
jgi:hypothetical protein